MKVIQLFVIGRLAAVILAVGTSAYLCANNLDGWGWFLFAGVCITPSYKESTGQQ